MNRRTSPRNPKRRPVQRATRRPRASRSSPLKSIFLAGCLVTALLMILFSIAGLTVAKSAFTRITSALGILDIFNSGEREVTVALPDIEEIRKLGRLDTVEVDLSTVVQIINKRGSFIELEEKLNYSVCGRAVAGVDLTRMEPEHVLVSGAAITISLPQAEVFSVDPVLFLNVPALDEYDLGKEKRKAEILPACNYAYTWDTPPGMSRTPELVKEAEEQAMVQFKKLANQAHVLERAQDNAEEEMARFFKLMGYERINFVDVH